VVPAAGTPVQISVTPTPVNSIRFSVIAGGTGTVYLGAVGMNKSTLAGVLREFWPSTTGPGPDDSFTLPVLDRETYTLSDYWVDANVSGKGLLVSAGSAPL
jgi:hypothetical protein